MADRGSRISDHFGLSDHSGAWGFRSTLRRLSSIRALRINGFHICQQFHARLRLRAAILDPRLPAYLIGREPVMRMSTSLLALCCQSGPDATWETPISARSRSNGSRSLRMSRLSIARFTSESIAPWI
jgi:hypothetical protein